MSQSFDFKYTSNPVQHSFNSIALATLGPGSHTFSLVAYNHWSTPTGRFIVGSSTGMSVLTDPAPNVAASSLAVDSSVINFNTQGIGDSGPVPMATILSNFVSIGATTQKVVTLASGRSYHACTGCWGDALWGIHLDNESCQSNDEAVWSVNDITDRAELHAPMYAHSLHEIAGDHTIKLRASELSFAFENLVRYRIGASTRLITLWGMQVAGSAFTSTTDCHRADWICIGSSIGFPGCPPIGQWREIAGTTFTVPQGHNGVVLFMAKTRVQGGSPDLGGNMFLQIQVDGQFVGTVGVQQLTYPDSISSRTVTASYLSAGNGALAPGVHTVKAMATASSGSFMHLSVSRDMPLVFID